MEPDREKLTLSISPAQRKASRWVSVFLLVLLGVVVLTVPSNAAEDSAVESAAVAQKDASLSFQAVMKQPFGPRTLDRDPGAKDRNAEYLCFRLTPDSGEGAKRVCVGGEENFTGSVGVADLNADGRPAESWEAGARVRYPTPRKVRVLVPIASLGIEPGSYSLSLDFSQGLCGEDEECSGTYSGSGRSLELEEALPIGCTGGDGEVVRRGPYTGNDVALTFDDGPSEYSEGVVEALQRHGARGTFFLLGQSVSEEPELARDMLEAGNELGNHSNSHSELPGQEDIEAANDAIFDATGFRPCLFRAPYGVTDAAQSVTLGKVDMDNILWDVDTNDYSGPSAEMITESIVSQAGPGSIVLLHDGGGDRSQLAPALDQAIPQLQARGLELVTVTELLGEKFIYESDQAP